MKPNNALKTAKVRHVAQREYVNGTECTPGFHVFESDAMMGSRCVCGAKGFSITHRGFIKAKPPQERPIWA